MDGNIEEAIKAKIVAQKKMEKNDFRSALGFAVKAKQLYPDLENISNIILVCDVICSANKKVNGNENDWYAILKLDATADETTIKKQYRKFALNLHPDKNKLAGASDAFNLISQAQSVLLDRNTRLVYDMKLQAANVRRVNYQAYTQSDVKRQPPYQNSCTNKFASKFNNQQQQKKTQSANDGSTFWTSCPHCSTFFMFYKNILGKKVTCKNCKLDFTTVEKSCPTLPTGLSKLNSMQREEAGIECPNLVSNNGPKAFYSKAELKKDTSIDRLKQASESGPKTTYTKVELRKDTSIDHLRQTSESDPKMFYSKVELKPQDGNSNVESTIQESNHLSESNSRIHKKRKMEKSASDEEKQIPGNANYVIRKKIGFNRVENVQNNEAGVCMTTEENRINIKGRERHLSKDITQHREKNAENPDSEFSNFNNLRAKHNFKKGQIWAVYDSLDAMPRFYAIITEVLSPDFKVELTWLEPYPDNEEELKWIEEGLPVSCGKFMCGNSDVFKNIEMFSHLVYCEKRSGEDTYNVHPRRGETWALFKDWDISWYACSETKKEYAYEFVEVLSDYSSVEGVYVAFLTKSEGLSCIFSREKKGVSSVLIPAKEKFRFSHVVPSFKMTGEDSSKLVKVSFQLDPASLPTEHEDGFVFLHGSSEVDKERYPSSLCSKPSVYLAVNRKSRSETLAVKEDIKSSRKLDVPVAGFHKVEGKEQVVSSLQDVVEVHVDSIGNQNLASNLHSDTEATRISFSAHKTKSAGNATCTQDTTHPASKFYNFYQDKSPDKFKTGQIWAIYRNEASVPKYYGKIKKIDAVPAFTLYVAWLHTCSPQGNASSDSKEMPIGCGSYKLKPGRPSRFTNTDIFSHQMKAEPTDKKDVYAIFPKKSQIWAIYRDYKHGLNDFTCEIVEVMEENVNFLTVSVLEIVEGSKCVFRPQMNGRLNGGVQICRTEMFRFSHQIPAHRLTEVNGGRFHGFWELDAAALGNYLLHL